MRTKKRYLFTSLELGPPPNNTPQWVAWHPDHPSLKAAGDSSQEARAKCLALLSRNGIAANFRVFGAPQPRPLAHRSHNPRIIGDLAHLRQLARKKTPAGKRARLVLAYAFITPRPSAQAVADSYRTTLNAVVRATNLYFRSGISGLLDSQPKYLRPGITPAQAARLRSLSRSRLPCAPCAKLLHHYFTAPDHPTRTAVAASYGASVHQVGDWLRRFRRGGVAAVSRTSPRGLEPLLKFRAPTLSRLRAIASSSSPHTPSARICAACLLACATEFSLAKVARTNSLTVAVVRAIRQRYLDHGFRVALRHDIFASHGRPHRAIHLKSTEREALLRIATSTTPSVRALAARVILQRNRTPLPFDNRSPSTTRVAPQTAKRWVNAFRKYRLCFLDRCRDTRTQDTATAAELKPGTSLPITLPPTI